jgi:cobalt-zinc-cadmium efflux system membrane fusion protein
MKTMRPALRTIGMAALLVLAAGCGSREESEAGHAVASAEEFERGPHRGRMLRDGNFALELTIFEEGVPPEYRVYAYEGDEPLPPQGIELQVELGRLGGRKDRFAFRPEADFLRGDGVVAEPHSFDVKVTARRGGKTSTWSFASYEGRVQILAEAAEAAGIEVETAGPAPIREQLALTGVIQPNPARIARVRARFPGIVQQLRKAQGDAVGDGEVIARVQSNESLQNYAVTSPIRGTVLARSAAEGEATGEEPLYVIGDLGSVWAVLDVFGRDLGRVRPGQRVMVTSLDEVGQAEGTIAALSPVTTHSSQSVRARIVLDNVRGLWRPGQFVHGVVTVAEVQAPLAVKRSALQKFRDFTVVFARVGDTYEVRMLELGRNDDDRVEVLGGLSPGEIYVTGNSYLIKADIEKSGASHDH